MKRLLPPLVCLCLFAGLTGCEAGSSAPRSPPQQAGPYGYPAGPPRQGPYGAPQGQYGPPQGQYGAPPPYAAAPAPGSIQAPQGGAAPAPSFPVGSDPLNRGDLAWLRGRTGALLQELIASLGATHRARVERLPLVIDDEPGEVNAFAACTKGGAVLGVTDGLLQIAGYLARARATDELYGSRKVEQYIAFIAKSAAKERPLPEPAGLFTAAEEGDARRVARQHALFDELVGFVVGHELAHHYLGHLPCTGAAGPFGMGEIARGLSDAVPLFNHPNELASDAAGLHALLTAGKRRQQPMSEGGALLLMQFFGGMGGRNPADILFSFEHSHPVPAVRTPIIQQTAGYFRMTGGAPLPLLGL